MKEIYLDHVLFKVVPFFFLPMAVLNVETGQHIASPDAKDSVENLEDRPPQETHLCV